MCGIIIAKQMESVVKQFKIQYNRGLDSIGWISIKGDTITQHRIVASDYKKKINKTQNTEIELKKTDTEKLNEYVKYMEANDDGGIIIFHHRKASVGAVNIDNTHPIHFDNVIIMQNGTSTEIKDWIHIESIVNPAVKDNSDTYALGYLINKYPTKAAELINEATGVIVVTNKKNGRTYIYSDGKRSLFQHKDGTISSTDENNVEREANGSITIDKKLKVLENNMSFKKKTTTTAWNGYQRAENYYGGTYTKSSSGKIKTQGESKRPLCLALNIPYNAILSSTENMGFFPSVRTIKTANQETDVGKKTRRGIRNELLGLTQEEQRKHIEEHYPGFYEFAQACGVINEDDVLTHKKTAKKRREFISLLTTNVSVPTKIE